MSSFLSKKKDEKSYEERLETLPKEKIHKSNLESLKKGLMQKLLTGQIRVKV